MRVGVEHLPLPDVPARIVRIESYRLLEERRRLGRAPRRNHVVTLLGISGGKIAIARDRLRFREPNVERFQRLRLGAFIFAN